MDTKEFIQHWSYFCSIASLLDGTKSYVYHGVEENSSGEVDFVNGDVYSDTFTQIILLTSAEFEVICKSICAARSMQANNIVDITKSILQLFPQIGRTEVETMFGTCRPLDMWTVDDNGKVQGVEWWFAHNSLKHSEIGSYAKATLRNAVISVASLYVVDLYLMYELFHSIEFASEFPPVYFKSKYTSTYISSGEGLLPDYGNKTPLEALEERFPEIKGKVSRF